MEEIFFQVEAYVTANNISGWASLGPVISALKNTPELRWAPLDVKKGVEQVFLTKFGPKEAAKPKGKVSKKSDNDNSTSSYFITGIKVCCQS